MSPGRALPSTESLVLASGSPRRVELLKSLGLAFTIDVSGIAEDLEPGLSPEAQALRLARAKAKEVCVRHPDSTVLGADTLVVLEGRELTKPADPADAAEMLRSLRAREHS